MKFLAPVTALMAALLVMPTLVAAQETPVQIFRGLTTIETSVIGVTPSMEAEGLYARDIYDDIDRRLRGTRLLLRRGRAQPLAGTGIIDPLLQVTPICHWCVTRHCVLSVPPGATAGLARSTASASCVIASRAWSTNSPRTTTRFAEFTCRAEARPTDRARLF